MKSKLVIALALLLVLAFASADYAAKAGGAAKAGKAGKGKKNKNQPDATQPAPAQVDLTAAVTKIEGGKVTVTLELPTDILTRITIDGDATKAIADLKAGQNVKVTFSGNSVSKIEVQK